MPIMAEAVLIERRQIRGDSDDENNAEEDTFGFDLFLGGLYEKF